MTVAPEANLSATFTLDGQPLFSTSDAEPTLVTLGTHYFTVDIEPLPSENG